jgi:hypothetical protein
MAKNTAGRKARGTTTDPPSGTNASKAGGERNRDKEEEINQLKGKTDLLSFVNMTIIWILEDLAKALDDKKRPKKKETRPKPPKKKRNSDSTALDSQTEA